MAMHFKGFLFLAVQRTYAFPWIVNQPGVNPSLLKRQQPPSGAGSAADCPNNPVHPGAAPITDAYPYNGALNGVPGQGQGGVLVPDPNDAAHQFVAPDYTKDIRGPCPGTSILRAATHPVDLATTGLNTAANHNFLSHDGIVTFDELVDMQQNVYNVDYDLAALLAVLGLTTTDGEATTEKLSIGCDATARTSISPALTGSESGLDGHNHFEADTSLTRNDYFTHNGDNFNMNGTLFTMMQNICQGNFDLDCLALYRYQRWQQSQAENENFYFGPFEVLLIGTASFLYELFPSGTRGYTPDLYTISSFFGAQDNGDSTYSFNGMERIPSNWTNRQTPFSISDAASQILAMYLLYPVPFGGNTGPGTFEVITGPGVSNGNLTLSTPQDVSCLLYQLATERIPQSLNGFVTPTVDALALATSKLNPIFSNLGCPIPLSKRQMAAEWEAKRLAL